MVNDPLDKGKIFVVNEKEYTVLEDREDSIVVIERNTNRMIIFSIPADRLFHWRSTDAMEVRDAECLTYDCDLMSEEEKTCFDRYRKMMAEIDEVFGPSYLSLCRGRIHKEFREICEKYNVSINTARKYTVRYLQSGCNIFSLVDKRYHPEKARKPYNYKKKPGRKYHDGLKAGVILDDDIRDIFREMKGYWDKNPHYTLKRVYDDMIMIHFSSGGGRPKPINERPTFRQFSHFIYSKTTKQERDILKQGYRKYRNNSRPLTGDTVHNALGPGNIVEMDEQEMPVYIVSDYNKEQTVGKPILYLMVDTYTKAIVSFSVSWENNSFLGATNCLATLACDKEAFCEYYGVPYEPSKWPSNFKPEQIRCDRGSEYMGRNLAQVLDEQGITLLPLPGGMGSYKGTVEGTFSEYMKLLGGSLYEHGLVVKEYGSRHQKEAHLTMNNLIKIIIMYIYYHNSKDRSRTYPVTRDQINKKIPVTSAGIWKYGIEKFGSVRPIGNLDHFFYSMCVPLRRVTVDSKGLHLSGAVLREGGSSDKGLYYICDDDAILKDMQSEARGHVREFDVECRIDERDLGKIYYLRDGKMYTAVLNPYLTGNLDYDHCSLFVYRKEQKEREETARMTQESSEQLRLKTLSDINKEINKASRTTYSDSADLRTVQSYEKAVKKSEYSLSEKLAGNLPATLPDTDLPAGKEEAEDDILDNKEANMLNMDVSLVYGLC